MLQIIKVIFCVLYVALAEELYDVTTVYHVGTNYNNTSEEKSVEVHLRTNARGLPIFYRKKVVDDSMIGRVFPALTVNMNDENNNSLWQTKDWTRKLENQPLFYKVDDDFTPNSINLDLDASEIQKLPRFMGVKLEGFLSSNGYLRVFIFSHETELIRSQTDYYYSIAFTHKEAVLMRCSITVYGNDHRRYFLDRDGNYCEDYCKEITRFQIDNWIYDTNSATGTNSFVLDFSNGGVQMWSDLLHLQKVLDWKPSQEWPPIKPRYFSMFNSDMNYNYDLKASFSTLAALESNSSNSSPLISPWFTADLDHLCLAVVAKGFISFNVKAENADGSRYNLDFEEVNLYKKNWIVLHLTSPLPEQLKRSNIRLVLTPTSNDVFTIERISSCNVQGSDVAVLSLEEVKAIAHSKSKEITFAVHRDNRYEDSRWCLKNSKLDSNVTFTSNGGCKNGSTFACPPGFVGDKCETACGRNRFGLDCGGICSMYTEECKGIRLCTPAMGCHCAPGYYGENCEEQCEQGKYGNDCDQTCGQCAEPNNCDIYKGHCVTCEPGYFPPYCKDTYPVVKNAPIVSTNSFGQAKVTPILSDYSGRSVPTIYQIQYRESNQEINKWIIQDTFYNLSDIVSTTIRGLTRGKFYEVRVILFNDNSNNYQGDDVPTTKFRSLCTTYPVVKNAPIVSTPSFGQAEVTPILSDYIGRSVPTTYQIQYRESNQEINKWIIQDTFYNLSDIVSTTIRGLTHGKFYEVRVILFNNNSNNYQGEDVPTTKFHTLCTIPDSVDYYITSTVNTTSMTISWDYKNTSEYWCPVQHYQVSRKEQWKWITENTTDTSFTLTDLNSGGIIRFKVRAFTLLGFTPYSKPVRVSTVVKVPGPIESLSFQHKVNFELITWDPPREITSEKIDYLIKYQCLRRTACTLGCDPSDHSEVQTTNTNVTLDSLMPYTQYLVTVSAGKGPGTSLEIGTRMSVPTETVKASNLSPLRTNNSVTVSWEPVEVCSGFFKGYIYQLYKADDTQIVKTGFTKENHVTIDGLSAKTDYVARIYIENIVGWDADTYLLTNISTSATVPEKVENLTVYKRGRNLLGLRWEQPRKMNGVLKAFTINYGYRSNNNTIVVPPTPCIVWPDLYCHVLNNLSPNQKYTVTVAAKNAEVAGDGVPSSVIEVTKEGTAGLPESVEVVNTTSSSFAMAWKYPSMANGIIRSFVLSIEETERFESDKCCQIYPLFEATVKEELVNYSVEIAGLNPASTYTVSLSAKTVTFGQSKTLTIYTRPPPLPLQYLPEIYNLTQETWSWLPQNHFENLSNSDIYQPLIKGSILLVILDSRSEDFQSGIEHEQLFAELTKLIKTDFYFIAENQKGVPTITTEDKVQSVWGTTSIPQLNVGETYRFAAVQISEYCSVYNIDVVFSSTFQFSNFNYCL